MPWRLKNRDQYAFRHPDLKGEDSDEDEEREELRRIVDFLVVDGVGLDHPEKRVLPAQAFKTAVHQDTHQAETDKHHQRQPQPA